VNIIPFPASAEDNRVDDLLDELARHEQYRPAGHDRAECARCRLLAYLAGEGDDRVQEVRSYA